MDRRHAGIPAHYQHPALAVISLLFGAMACKPCVTRVTEPVARESRGSDAGVSSVESPSVATISPAGDEAPLVSRYRYGCYDSSECRGAGAVCVDAPVIGECTCRTDDDCLPTETCHITCELRCDAAPNGCPRGGACWPDSFYKFCLDPEQESHNGFDLSEWLAKQEEGLVGHEDRYLHATYDEWDGSSRHLRVSFRANGDYVIEVDGIGGWNGSVVGSKHPNAKGRELLRTGILRGKGGVPAIAELNRGSCPGSSLTFLVRTRYPYWPVGSRWAGTPPVPIAGGNMPVEIFRLQSTRGSYHINGIWLAYQGVRVVRCAN